VSSPAPIEITLEAATRLKRDLRPTYAVAIRATVRENQQMRAALAEIAALTGIDFSKASLDLVYLAEQIHKTATEALT
jgi:hypothetical protein